MRSNDILIVDDEIGIRDLLRCLTIPSDRFGIVLAHALPIFIHHA